MKILKIIHGYPPEYNAGSEVYTQSVCNELCKKHEVMLFSREENEYAIDFTFRECRTEKGIMHIMVNMARGKDGCNHALLNERFKKLVNDFKPDVAHIGHLNHLSTGIVDVLYELKIPMLFTLHDFWLMCPRGQFLQRNFDGKTLYELCNQQENNKCAQNCYKMYFSEFKMSFDQSLFYEFSHKIPEGRDSISDIEHWTNWIDSKMYTSREICRKVSLFIAPSQYLRNRFINDFDIPGNKIIYLDYGFPTHYLKPVIPKTNGIYTFGYIGTHIPAKGINLLIESFKKLNGKVKLKIYGREQGQNSKALKDMACTSENEIEFCGEYINHNLATDVFNHVNCIVVPSIWTENSPLVIHEAQACRIPVITADAGGMAEYVNHKINGLLFKHRDADSLAEQMQWAVDNQKFLKKLGQKGYLYDPQGEVPTIESHCKELEMYYEKLICYEK